MTITTLSIKWERLETWTSDDRLLKLIIVKRVCIFAVWPPAAPPLLTAACCAGRCRFEQYGGKGERRKSQNHKTTRDCRWGTKQAHQCTTECVEIPTLALKDSRWCFLIVSKPSATCSSFTHGLICTWRLLYFPYKAFMCTVTYQRTDCRSCGGQLQKTTGPEIKPWPWGFKSAAAFSKKSIISIRRQYLENLYFIF